MATTPRTTRKPQITRQTNDQARTLADAAGLGLSRVSEMLLLAYADGLVLTGDLTPIPYGGDKIQISVTIDNQAWNRASARADRDSIRMPALLAQLITAYADGRLTIGVMRTPHALAA